MKMTRILPPLALTLFSAVAAAGPSGYAPPPQKIFGAGTVVVRAGVSYLIPRSDQVSFINTSPFIEDDDLIFREAFRATLDPDEEWGWNVSGMWMPIDHFAFELSFVWGNKHDGGDSRRFFDLDFDGRDFARYESQKSQAMINWYPLDPTCMFQPYVGVGINYTDFNDEELDLFRDFPEFRGLGGDLQLGHSWGFAWQVGADLVFGRDSNWLVNASATFVDSETDLGFDIHGLDIVFDDIVVEEIASFSGDYRYNPWTFNLSLGYKFSF